MLRDKGHLLTVTPAKNHLAQLKQLIYRDAQPHDESKQPIDNLTLVHQETLSYTLHFDNSEDILNLLSMTPFAFKVTDALTTHIQGLSSFECEVDFLIRLYQKDC